MESVSRTKYVTFFFIFVAMVLIIRLFSLQITHGEHYKNLVLEQSGGRPEVTTERSTIFFTTKSGDKVPAALTKYGFSVAINPRNILDPEDAYRQISQFLDTDKEEFLAKASKEDDPYEIIEKRIDYDTGRLLQSKVPFLVHLQPVSWRHYPHDSLASRVIGFTGQTASDPVVRGRYGIEREFDSKLSFLRRSEQNFLSFLGTSMYSIPTQDQHRTISLTIEPVIQGNLEETLLEAQNQYQAKGAGGIVLDPKTGQVIAMGYTPRFDPNNLGAFQDQRLFKNPLVESVYEFGSVIKPFIVATALEEGSITSNYRYEDEGSIEINEDITIWNYDKRGRGEVGLQEILGQSLNTGMVDIITRTEPTRIKTAFEKAGATQKTQITLPNEANNLTNSLNNQSEVDFASLSFGQSIALTPISAAASLASLANHGQSVTPSITPIELKNTGKQVFSRNTTQEITRLLIDATKENFADSHAIVNTLPIAAKTGTAQIAKPGGGGYFTDRNLHTMIGYFPAQDPEFFMLLYLEEPKGARYAASTMAKPFFETIEFIANYYQL
ncbi:MAG: penicillin-binding protein 2 [Bacteroidota bacterium]